jgi:hypothetical protein
VAWFFGEPQEIAEQAKAIPRRLAGVSGEHGCPS